MTAVDTRPRNIELKEAIEQSAAQITKSHRRERELITSREYKAATEVVNARVMERNHYLTLLAQAKASEARAKG